MILEFWPHWEFNQPPPEIKEATIASGPECKEATIAGRGVWDLERLSCPTFETRTMLPWTSVARPTIHIEYSTMYYRRRYHYGYHYRYRLL